MLIDCDFLFYLYRVVYIVDRFVYSWKFFFYLYLMYIKYFDGFLDRWWVVLFKWECLKGIVLYWIVIGKYENSE